MLDENLGTYIPDMPHLSLLFDLKGKRVYVAGHNGMVGSAIMRRLESEHCEILAADRKTLDLTNQRATEDWLAQMRPDAIFLAAGLVGGIHAASMSALLDCGLVAMLCEILHSRERIQSSNHHCGRSGIIASLHLLAQSFGRRKRFNLPAQKG
jgi:hypothetical protein